LWLLASPSSAQLDASDWRTLLSTYGSDAGFRYSALQQNRAHRELLARFVRAIGDADVHGLSRNTELAFYLDAYNALVVSAVIERGPRESVMRVPGFFDRITHRVAGRTMTLNQLETFVRTRFTEPRIHFALNCASASCPPLSRTPYSMERDLLSTLEQKARAFIRRTTRIDRAAHTIRVSQIFEWYARDFGNVRTFLAARLDAPSAAAVRDPSFRIAYVPYDWALR
jgi:hypothetical protein